MTPNFETMSAPELEKHIQGLSAQVDTIRAEQRAAHDFLEMRQQQDRRKEIASRGPMPAAQLIAPALPQLGEGTK